MLAPVFAAFAAASAASTVYLSTESSKSELNGKSIAGFHEAAGLSTFFLSDDKKDSYFQYDQDKIYMDANESVRMFVGTIHDTFTLGGSYDSLAAIDNGYVTINNSPNVFYVCENYVPYDPYRYEQQGNQGISVFTNGESLRNCEPIKIKASTVSN